MDVTPRPRKTAWGGKRSRAGRKPTLKDPVSITLDLERPDADALKAIASERDASVASLVRAAVSAYLKRRRGKN